MKKINVLMMATLIAAASNINADFTEENTQTLLKHIEKCRRHWPALEANAKCMTQGSDTNVDPNGIDEKQAIMNAPNKKDAYLAIFFNRRIRHLERLVDEYELNAAQWNQDPEARAEYSRVQQMLKALQAERARIARLPYTPEESPQA